VLMAAVGGRGGEDLNLTLCTVAYAHNLRKAVEIEQN
jgi:hypothetical protein